MSALKQSEAAVNVSEAEVLHDKESINQIGQLLENLTIVRRVYYTLGKNYTKTIEYFQEHLGKQHTEFVAVLLDYVVSEFEFHEEHAPASF